MPAPAVIPAPIAYIKVVAVKKLVVGFRDQRSPVCREVCTGSSILPSGLLVSAIKLVGLGSGSFTLKKLECSKQALTPLHTPAWNNRIGLYSYFVGF